MASILERLTKEKVPYFTANVRMRGIKLARSFPTRREAERWAIRVEGAIEEATEARPFDRAAYLEAKASVPVAAAAEPEAVVHAAAEGGADAGSVVEELAAEDHHEKPNPAWSLRKAMRHYMDTVTPGKRGWKAETDRIIAWTTAQDRLQIIEYDIEASRRGGVEPDPKMVIDMVSIRHRANIGGIRLDRLRAADIQPLVSARNRAGLAPTTIRNEYFLVTAIFNHASDEPYADGSGGWGLGLTSNLDRVKLPKPPQHRDRRLQKGRAGRPGEWDRLQDALKLGPDPEQMMVLTTILLETACRLSEPLTLKGEDVEDVDEGRCLRLRKTKNGKDRRIYLSTAAWAVLDTLPLRRGQPIFTMDVPDIEYRWQLACKRAGITDLHMHDLRHEGLSRMAARKMPLQHLMSQSGHSDARTLAKYLNTSADEIVAALG